MSNSPCKAKVTLAVVCAYHVLPDNEWLLKLQLEYIRKYCSNYRVYAGNVRLEPLAKKILKADPCVDLYDVVTNALNANREHAQILDVLISKAIDDGCEYILTLDVDSFPINPQWFCEASAMLDADCPVVAVLRAENDDVDLTHPCGIFFRADFAGVRELKMYPDEKEMATREFQLFLSESKQPKVDTGIGLSYLLWRRKLKWKCLERSNTENVHYLMGGIYGGMIFHLGASSRKPIFYRDFSGRLGRFFFKAARLAHALAFVTICF
ncbi:MAG: hypothetical protein K9K86_01740 [Pseudomonadales bacterium]|nr:hypothetical protein [Pseudomonadales bacterium]